MTEKRYFVANDKGELAGHDLNYEAALQCLDFFAEKYPLQNWTIEEQDEE